MSSKEQQQAIKISQYEFLIQQQRQQIQKLKNSYHSLSQLMHKQLLQKQDTINRIELQKKQMSIALQAEIKRLNQVIFIEREKAQKEKAALQNLLSLNEGRNFIVQKKNKQHEKNNQQEDYSIKNKRNIFNDRYFQTQNEGNHLKIIGKRKGDWHGYYYSNILKIGQITRLQVKQIKTDDKDIMYGVCSDKTIGQDDPHLKIWSVSYYSCNGRVYQNRTHREGGALIEDGSIVTIEADLINWKVRWICNNQQLSQTMFTPQMKQGRLYFMLCMYCKDVIEIIGHH